MPNQSSFQTIVTNGIALAKEKGWKIIKGKCLVNTIDSKGKTKTCLCPMMACWLQGLDEKSRAKVIKKGSILPATLARNLGKRLNVHPHVIQQFMGNFDDAPGTEKSWPRGMSDLDITMALLMEVLAVELRKKLRPRFVA